MNMITWKRVKHSGLMYYLGICLGQKKTTKKLHSASPWLEFKPVITQMQIRSITVVQNHMVFAERLRVPPRGRISSYIAKI